MIWGWTKVEVVGMWHLSTCEGYINELRPHLDEKGSRRYERKWLKKDFSESITTTYDNKVHFLLKWLII